MVFISTNGDLKVWKRCESKVFYGNTVIKNTLIEGQFNDCIYWKSVEYYSSNKMQHPSAIYKMEG